MSPTKDRDWIGRLPAEFRRSGGDARLGWVLGAAAVGAVGLGALSGPGVAMVGGACAAAGACIAALVCRRARRGEDDALMRAIHNAVNESYLISITDARGVIVGVNDEFCQVSGYTRPELVGRTHAVVNSGRHARSFWSEMWRTVAGGTTWRGEVCNRAKDGSEYWVDSVISPIKDAAGRVTGYVSIRNEVTERRRLEVETADRERRLRAILEGANVIVWEFDPGADVFTYVSPQASRLGYATDEWASPGFWERTLHPEDRDRVVTFCREETARDRGHRLRYRMARKDGTFVWIDDSVNVERDEQGRRVLRGVFVDVTELMEAHAAASAATKAKSEFLANMSHEIRTPLTAIMGFADLLREDLAEEAGSGHRLEHLDTIRSAGQHLLVLINDILDLSKVEAGSMSVEVLPTPIVRLLADVESMLRPKAALKGVELRVELETPIPDVIMSDPTRVRQILMNLVGNAVKFTAAGCVRVRVGRQDDAQGSRLLFAVQDTGPGLTGAQRARLFAPFSQGDVSVARFHGGTGLGLRISRRLADLMGGQVDLDWTEPGRGSCFCFVIPLVAAPGSVEVTTASGRTAPMSVARDDRAPELRGRILLAEDSPDSQRLIAHHLRRAGAEVDLVNNGAEALVRVDEAMARGNAYDLIVSDIQMPEMDGFTLVRTLRSIGCSTPVVALTAHAMSEDRVRCLDAGFTSYASKPIDRAALIRACEEAMGRGVGARAA